MLRPDLRARQPVFVPLHTVAITSQPGLQFCPQTLPSRMHSRVPCPPPPPHTAAYIDLQNRHSRPRDVTEVATIKASISARNAAKLCSDLLD